MKPAQLIATIRSLGPQDLSVVLYFFADHLYSATLASGERISDATSFKAFLEECGDAAHVKEIAA